MANISKEAGVPVGNIYRYYKNKEAILHSVLPQDLTERLFKIVEKKVLDWKSGESREMNLLNSEKFINYLSDNRAFILILFKMEKNGSLNKFKTELTNKMMDFINSVYSLEDDKTIYNIYWQIIGLIEMTLELYESKEDLKKAFETINRYHMFGITKTLV